MIELSSADISNRNSRNRALPIPVERICEEENFSNFNIGSYWLMLENTPLFLLLKLVDLATFTNPAKSIKSKVLSISDVSILFALTISELLKDLPEQYRTRFTLNISEFVGQMTTSSKLLSMITQKSFSNLPFFKITLKIEIINATAASNNNWLHCMPFQWYQQ